MHLNWTSGTVGVLGLFIFYAPFFYKQAREKRAGHAEALLFTFVAYILFCLWIAGAADVLYGIGMAIDEPAEYCGIDCVQGGSGHWEGLKAENILAGIGMMGAGWIIGKAAQKRYGDD